MSNIRDRQKKNLVIVGGGFAGTTLAAKLEKKLSQEWEIYYLVSGKGYRRMSKERFNKVY